MLWLQSLWHFVFGWPAVSTVIGGAAVAVAVLAPPMLTAIIPQLRTAAIYTAIAAFSFTALAGKYYHDGLAEKQRQWDAALVKEAGDGETARSDAERLVDGATDRRVFDNDPRNRDRGKHAAGGKGPVRWLETNHLFGR